MTDDATPPPATVPPRGDRVSASVFVAAPPALAFEVFTEQIDQWWRHGLKFRVGARGRSVLHLEPRPGGRLFEAIAEGDAPGAPVHVVQTGTVTAWNPPHALCIEWRGVNFAPTEATTVAVRFVARGDGTEVTLVHSGFASLPANHPVRHGEPVERFVARMAMWWADLLGALRGHVPATIAARPDMTTPADPRPADAPWMAIARAELGVRNFPAGASNPRITAYHAGTNIPGYDDKANWCSSFVDWTLRRAGIAGTGSALARSWLDWGDALDAPREGCIAVLWRDDPRSWKGHVGFFVRIAGDQVVLLGGNQLEQVCEHAYPLASVLAWRWPATH